MKILAIESSCDETAAAVIEDGRKIISNIIYSQAEMHSIYGGVVPEIASRKHIEVIEGVVSRALDGIPIDEIDAVAATTAPGLIGALLVGVNFAKSLAFSLEKPFIPVHHLRGHIAANYLAFPELKPPFLCLCVSGGNSIICRVNTYTDISIIGSTLDDAAGECFDKVARVLGIGYPGGAIIDGLASGISEDFYKFPRSNIKNSPLDFSFSGLKTSVINTIHKANQKGEIINKNHLCASVCYAISDTLVPRLKLASELTGINTLAVAGGVSANSIIRADIEKMAKNKKLYLLPLNLCSDNAAMIGAQAFYEFNAGNVGNSYQNARATMDIKNNFSI